MYRSPSPLPEAGRQAIAAALDARLADGLDLWSQIKVAHWNIKGPGFTALHPLFDTFATGLAAINDELAERAATLGAQVHGTARQVARTSQLEEYPPETSRDLDHVRLLADRIESYLGVVRGTRELAGTHHDQDSVDLLTRIILEFEKHAWFLRASLSV